MQCLSLRPLVIADWFYFALFPTEKPNAQPDQPHSESPPLPGSILHGLLMWTDSLSWQNCYYYLKLLRS